jgi:hypothetical protein
VNPVGARAVQYIEDDDGIFFMEVRSPRKQFRRERVLDRARPTRMDRIPKISHHHFGGLPFLGGSARLLVSGCSGYPYLSGNNLSKPKERPKNIDFHRKERIRGHTRSPIADHLPPFSPRQNSNPKYLGMRTA